MVRLETNARTEPVAMAVAVDDELHDGRAVVLDARAPSRLVVAVVRVQVPDGRVAGDVGDEPPVAPAAHADGVIGEPCVQGAVPGSGTVAERAHQERRVDGGAEVPGGVDRVQVGALDGEPVPPQVGEHLPADGALADHRDDRAPSTAQLVAEPRHDPFRHVEVALAGARIEADLTADVRLRRQVAAAERADRRVRHPRRVAEDEQRVRQIADPRHPVDGEDVGFPKPHAGHAAPRGAEVTGIAVDPEHDLERGERRRGGGEERAGAARRLEDGARRDAARGEQATDVVRQRGRRLEVAELVAAHRRPRAGSRSDGRRAPVARNTRPPITLLATITRTQRPPYATALG